MVPVGVIPGPMIAVPVVGTVPVAVVGISESDIPSWGVIVIVVIRAVGIEAPVPGVIVHINIGVAATAGVIVIVIVHGAGGLGAEALDTGGKVGIIVSLGGGVHHAVGVGHGLSGLVHGFDIGFEVLVVGVIRLVVVLAAGGLRADSAAVARGVLPLRIIIR